MASTCKITVGGKTPATRGLPASGASPDTPRLNRRPRGDDTECLELVWKDGEWSEPRVITAN